MDDKTYYKFVAIVGVFIIISISVSIGVFIGHRQAKDWNVIQKHHELELDKNYQYCPYCGEMLKR